jgi:hypothetical protein
MAMSTDPLALQQCDHAATVRYAEDSLVLFRETADERWIAYTLATLGHALLNQGDWRGASKHYEVSLGLSRDHGEEWGTVRGVPLVLFGVAPIQWRV